MSRAAKRYRWLRRMESRLRRAHVPASALTGWLAGPIVGGGFRLRGDDATFDVDGVRLVTPRRFVPHFIQAPYEPDLLMWLDHNLAPGGVAIDVGAHVGYLSIVMAKLVGSAGHVYAIEPALENVAYLTKNLEANHVRNVDILPVAAAAEPGLATFRINESSDSFGFFEHPNTSTISTRSVPVMSIDSIFSESSLPRLDLIKIDVEGAELETLSGLQATLERFPRLPLVVEWFPAAYASRGIDSDLLPNELASLGYSVDILDPAGREGPSTVGATLRALGRNELPSSWYCNLLAQR